MTSIANTKILWTVEVRLSRKHKWRAKGTFETRSVAREEAFYQRSCVHRDRGTWVNPLGFGNTRVVKKITGGL